MPLMPLLHIAARNGNCTEQGHEAAVSLLLDSGADNEICDADGKSPLFLAVSAGYTIVVNTILSHRKKR
ncbi:hypothetical protein N7501_011055 [Penicillium viridicatum]|nr:hypothetical protein N7501_011055 [Penicillium viridicatum]